MNHNFNSKLKQSKKHFTIISLNKIEESASVVSDNLSSYNDKYTLLKKLSPDISRKKPNNLKIITNVKGELNNNDGSGFHFVKEFLEPKSPQSCSLTKMIKMQSNNGRKLKKSKSP